MDLLAPTRIWFNVRDSLFSWSLPWPESRATGWRIFHAPLCGYTGFTENSWGLFCSMSAQSVWPYFLFQAEKNWNFVTWSMFLVPSFWVPFQKKIWGEFRHFVNFLDSWVPDFSVSWRKIAWIWSVLSDYPHPRWKCCSTDFRHFTPSSILFVRCPVRKEHLGTVMTKKNHLGEGSWVEPGFVRGLSLSNLQWATGTLNKNSNLFKFCTCGADVEGVFTFRPGSLGPDHMGPSLAALGLWGSWLNRRASVKQ